MQHNKYIKINPLPALNNLLPGQSLNTLFPMSKWSELAHFPPFYSVLKCPVSTQPYFLFMMDG